MASLTPGVLSKLLQHAGDSTFKALGQHRTPLLQVIEIVPALSADDPWRTRGFYLKLSDSEHSAYASVPDDDVDLIYGDKIQLGQFVHISRLDSGKPVPVIRGIKPLPRRRPCVGTPKDLISCDLLQPRKKKGGLVLHELKCPRGSLGSGKRQVLDDVLKPPRGECLGAGRRLSLDSARRGWDHHPSSTPRSTIAAQSSFSRLKSASETPRRASLVASFETRHVSSCTPSHVASDKKPSRPVVASITNNASGISSLQSKDKILINDSKPPVRKVLLSDKLDKNILWDCLPTKIRELGKGAVSHRDVAILIASRALEEASAMDGIVGYMSGTDDGFVASMFADLCESSENGSAGSVVETFLDLHLSIERTASTIDKLLASSVSNFNSISCVSQHLSLEISEDLVSKNAAAWIQAAVETDFLKFCLYSKQDKKGTLNDEKSYLVVLEKTAKEAPKSPLPNTKMTRSQVSYLLNGAGKVHRAEHPLRKHSSAPRKFKSDKEQWFSQNGLKDAACLAQKLIWVSRQWFLKYLETSLKKGFGIQGEDKSTQMTSLFGNLKRVNQWLEELVGCKHEIDERIEAVRKKLYNFLLENVESAGQANK